MLFETQATTNYAQYYSGGLRRAKWLFDIAAEVLSDGPLRVCEWGCGPARLIRHMPSFSSAGEIEAYGTDYSESIIEWCRGHIHNVHFELNDLEPPLPFPDEMFNLLYSNSVYTHLSRELQFRWFQDNLRVVKPGGIVSLSVHGDALKDRLLAHERREYEDTGFAVRAAWKPGGPWFTAYNSPRFMEHEFLAGLEIVRTEIHGEDEKPPRQDIWVVRKPY
jgi:SAM-dependent methyltransferase